MAAQARPSAPAQASARKTEAREEEGSPTLAPAPWERPEPVRAAPAAPGLGLDDPEALRKAFILKTVLDKPLALRPRR